MSMVDFQKRDWTFAVSVSGVFGATRPISMWSVSVCCSFCLLSVQENKLPVWTQSSRSSFRHMDTFPPLARASSGPLANHKGVAWHKAKPWMELFEPCCCLLIKFINGHNRAPLTKNHFGCFCKLNTPKHCYTLKHINQQRALAAKCVNILKKKNAHRQSSQHMPLFECCIITSKTTDTGIHHVSKYFPLMK